MSFSLAIVFCRDFNMDIDNIPVNSVRQAFPCGRLDSSISKSISIKRTVRDHRTTLWLRNRNNYCVF